MTERDREQDTDRKARTGAERPSSAPTLASNDGNEGREALTTSDMADADALRSGFSITANPATTAFSAAPARGERIGEGYRFEIIDKLGQGGMGHVFRATDSHLDRTVAIKFILQSHGMPVEQLATLMKREAKATAKLNHENIVAIFDMDAYNGMPFLVMELLDGQSLDVMIERTQLAPLRATRVMTQVARGLMHAHSNGVVHRDLKPSNVFILRDGRAKILDFGISRFERPLPATLVPSDIAPTISGVGTPAFMAPEQWRQGPQDARTDIWAAGVMFYQMLTGQLPYRVPELLRFKLNARVRSVAPSARLVLPALPEEADRIIATALNEEPEGRYQTAHEFWEALRELERILAGVAADSDIVSGGAPQVERRPMTLLSCALDGQEAHELDDIIDEDHRFYQICAEVMKRHDGAIGVPIGGRFFCCFGYPAATETDAQRAVRAALAILDAMREAGGVLGFRIGVHSGVVGLPTLPSSGLGVPAMQGNVPIVALRLCELAPPNSVVMSHATNELTSGLFSTERLNESERWAGRDDVAAYEVKRELESMSRFEQAFAGRTTPFVGRDAEFRVLCQLWEEAKDGRGQVLVVTGDPGIGKSRLLQQLKERVIDEQNTRLTCQCRPQYKNSALHPVLELVLRSMSIRREDTPETKLEKAENSLRDQGFTLSEAVPLFAPFLSIPLDARYTPLEASPEQLKVRTLEGLVSMLLRMALVRPTLFIIEDMHWVDHSTIEFLNALVDLVPASRLLVVLTCRPEFRAPWSARRHLHHLKLDRLSSAFTASMITRVAKGRELPADTIRQLVATTDGVPLFVEELTRMVLESSDEGWSGSRTTIPGTLHELLLARLDRLRGLGKDVAQLAAVLGRDFNYQLVRHVATFDEMSLQQGLELLVHAGLLHHQGKPPEAKYMFKHALIQQAAYQSLVKSERQRYHRRTAQVLTESFSEIAELEPELLAYHHAEAGNASEAIEFWERAGQRAIQRSALVEAIDHYARARETLRTLPEGVERDKKELSLLLAMGSPLMSVHGYAAPEVERTYGRARELARSAGGQGELFPAMQGLWQFYYVRGMLPTSRALGEQLLEIAEEAANSSYLLLAHRCVASSAFLQGDFEPCNLHTRAGMSIYRMEEHGALALRTGHDPGVAHGVYQAWTQWMLGFADRSASCVDDMIELAERLEHPLTMAYALCFAALMRNHRGDYSIARDLAEEALVITTENRFALWSAWARMQQGWGIAGLGDFARGIPLMREGLEGWKNTGARVGFTFFPVTLAEMCINAGSLEDAATLLDDSVPVIEKNDEHFFEAELWRLKGELSLRLGRDAEHVAEAERLFLRAIELARAQNAKSWELRSRLSRARLWVASGRSAEALAELEAVYAWFTEGLETTDLRAARALIEELRRSAG